MSGMTNHGQERMRKRLGLNKKALEKEFALALKNGKHHNEFKGRFKKYLDKNASFYHSRPIVYHQNIYWVSWDDQLITVYQVPPAFRKYV